MASPDAEKRAQALLEQGATLYEQGKLYEALSCWKQVLQIDPQNEIATEYLRFIEDNFQIGVDAFMEHHDREPESMPARSIESQASIGGDAGESYEELDWSEILDEGPDRNLKKVAAAPVPVDLSTEHGDDDFFAELKEPSPAPATARASEVAWGANDELNDSGVMMSMPVPPPEPALQPEADPLSLPASRFAAPYRAPASADLPSSPSESMGNASRRRRTSVVEAVPSARRRTAGLPMPGDDGPGASTERRGRDMADMADESIQRQLDDEFKVFEESGPSSGSGRRDVSSGRGRNAGGADDVDDLEALLSRGLGELPSGSGTTRPAGTTNRSSRQQPPSSGPRSNPPTSPPARTPTAPPSARASQPPPPRASTPGMGATSRTGPSAAGRETNDIESLIRAGLADLERGAPTARPSASTPPRKPASEPPARAPAASAAGAGGGVTFSAPPPGADLDDLMLQARRKQSLGDFSGSLLLVEQVLTANADHVEARRYLTENTARLLEMYRSKLGKIAHRPRLKLRQQEIIWQSLDHRAGFLLSQVDGGTSYEDIIEISGLSELEATRLLAKLVDQGVIG